MSDPRGGRRANTLTQTIKSNGVCPVAVGGGGGHNDATEHAEEHGSTPAALSVMAPNTHR